MSRPLPESELVERARAGDAQAYEALVREHQGIAFRTAYLITGSAADAEEAAQDGFVKAYRALGRFRRGAPFRPWVLEIVANEARNRRRSAGRRTALALRAAGEAPSGDAAPSPEGVLLAAEEREGLLEAVNRLARGRPARDRLPLLPRAVRGGDGRGARRSGAAPSSRGSPARSSGCAPSWGWRHERARAPAAAARPASSTSRSRRTWPPASSRRIEPARPRAVLAPAGAARRRRRALVVAVGAVLAVPPARSAILEFFGIGSAEIRIVDELPEVEAGPLDLGDEHHARGRARAGARAARAARRRARRAGRRLRRRLPTRDAGHVRLGRPRAAAAAADPGPRALPLREARPRQRRAGSRSRRSTARTPPGSRASRTCSSTRAATAAADLPGPAGA